MTKFFNWYTLGFMLAVSVLDLIFLPSFGAGFVFTFLYFAAFLLLKPKGNEVS